MLKTRTSLGAIALSLSLTTPLAAQEPSAATVLATVGGVNITLGHVITATDGLQDQYKQLDDAELLQGILDQMIRQQALSLALGDTVSTEVALSLENETRAVRANVYLQDVANRAVTDEALQAIYDTQYGQAEVAAGTEFNASHILVETEEEALGLVAELNDGADFAELARNNSTGPSGPNGGLLGWFGAGQMVPAFEAAVVSLTAGEISAPVQTQFGWHVVKLNESRPIATPSLEDVRGDLVNALQAEAVQNALTAAGDSSAIEKMIDGIDPALIRRKDLLD